MGEPMYTDDDEMFQDLNHDPVDSPRHYQLRINGVDTEMIDVIRSILGERGALAYCHGSALKYIGRVGKKVGAPTAQDFRKAAWFCTFASQIAEDLEGEAND
jgi:hypothetical protein